MIMRMSFKTVNYMVVLLDITIRLGALHMTRRQRQRLENSRGARMSGCMPFSVILGVNSAEKSLRRTGNTMTTVILLRIISYALPRSLLLNCISNIHFQFWLGTMSNLVSCQVD
jgi:hypothetical protein